MGLDNGIMLRHRSQKEVEDNIGVYANVIREPYVGDEGKHGYYEYEVCYWRKCWGLRDKILAILGDKFKDEDYECELTIKDLEAIREIEYGYMCDPDEWDENGSTIWDFNDMLPHFAKDIVSISWLIEFLKRHPKAYAYFYDSY